ncbi:nucleoside triphosphate pyrophosphohydrolase [Actinoplanes sp. SE50]|uniref:nucleoside triphosphate pyrophosphohydrolase n=1 Tax=unclassified Actinoplanes TaxID=2626549 RepID=UPI00023EC02C|nr:MULTISPECIES: nucleoside triphosphate pyrophosphohydrolase [unclassified Actinoplanes]AEV81826.1 nucleoside-triphosphate pyrophosphatase [Actinoplanes sp. SE50/110]ATO80227.1 nucleoside triphosphate pyrophosphohydrolase [Actinoplanes sp. SE50]SLL97632.1 nucleoside triphosphate pyrophosphohydrolase [Actinoplanes sp. SE50/110]
MSARIVLLVTSPRLPAGLLTAEAWDTVRSGPVFAAAESPQAEALRAAGVPVTVLDIDAQGLLDAIGAAPLAVWLAGPHGDQPFARQLGLRLAREPGLAELELMYGSWDPPGARLLDAVTVMDRLASPGGDPWKRAQTHRTLAPYLLEESYEAYDAIEREDYHELREELGDVLLQVVLHARLAEDLPDGRAWNIDDVAGILVEKMVRRNPHVFAGETVEDLEEITANWERIKREEKARESVLDGVALSQPALALAAKVLQRAARGGVDVPLPAGDELGAGLLRLVAEARAAGHDPEAELRAAVLTYAEAVRAAEKVGPPE